MVVTKVWGMRGNLKPVLSARRAADKWRSADPYGSRNGTEWVEAWDSHQMR
jgi:hypothetical protein